MSRTRRQATVHEKGEYIEYYTAGEAAKTLGISVQQWDRWVKASKIPKHNVRTGHGWRLWSPVVVREAVDRRTRGEL